MKQTNPDSPEPQDAPEASVSPTEATPPDPQPDETIKETFESIIIAFILAFVFRAYVVEAFVIPTGSMAPTLLGAHYRAECDQCGYGFKINYNPQRDNPRETPVRDGATCPMCRYNINMSRNARYRPGDRILVHKYIYTLSEPRRWDVVVFKAPHTPDTNFIKRLVGLPKESIRLLDGNIYTQAEGSSTWNIARKSELPRVQRTVWQPIYHSQYIPRDKGELLGLSERNAVNRWEVPWVVESGDWQVENRRSYVFEGGGSGRLAFDFRIGGNTDLASIYAYNQWDPVPLRDKIEDIRLGVYLETQSPDTSIELSTRTRLTGPPQTVTARVDADGTVSLFAIEPTTEARVELMTEKSKPLNLSAATPIEFWSVDQELSVWVHGKRVLLYRFADDLSYDELANRPAPERLPKISIELAGGPATLHQVELDRDLYYASVNPNGTRARGGMIRDSQGEVMAEVRPMTLYDDEYFCIGDNSPLSDDGRFWDPDASHMNNSNNVSPDALWVRERYFERDVKDNLRDGIVPGELMMGRAFFVYFPAPYSLKPNGSGFIPNFDDMRFIH